MVEKLTIVNYVLKHGGEINYSKLCVNQQDSHFTPYVRFLQLCDGRRKDLGTSHLSELHIIMVAILICSLLNTF